jgi:hypothetical protein
LFYQIMTAMENVEVQQKGIVAIAYNNKAAKNKSSDTLHTIMKMFHGFPWRIQAIHFCSTEDAPVTKLFANFFQFVVGKEGRVRFRCHFGSHMEVQYNLMSFGINIKNFPFDMNGAFQPEKHPTFLEQHQAIEIARKNKEKEDGTIVLTGHDVLLGRGRPIQDFPGNIALCDLVDQNIDRYRACAKSSEKDVLFQDIIQSVKTSGGRFLRRINGENGQEDHWVIADDTQASEKIFHR